MTNATRKNQRGSATVELGLVIAVFMFIVMGIVDISHYMHTRSKVQHAVSQAARFAVTGGQLADENAEDGSLLSRAASIKKVLSNMSGIEFGADDIELYTVAVDGTLTPGAGGGGDVILVQVNYGVDLFTPGLAHLFDGGRAPIRCSTRFRAEEFSS